MYSIVKDQQNEYMSVEQPDFSTLMKLTDSCKGNRTDTQFERKAALSVSFLTKVRNGKKKRGFSLDEITKIVESQRSSGNVTKDSMIAVNGMVPYDNLVKIVQAIKPEKTDKKDFRITYLSAYLSSDDILFFKENIARIFKDKALVKMIYKFKMHREQEMKNLTAAISTTEEIDTTLSGYYMDMILEMVRKEEKPDDVAVENKKSIKTISDEKSLKPIGKKKPQKAVSDNKCSWFMTPDMSVFDKA